MDDHIMLENKCTLNEEKENREERGVGRGGVDLYTQKVQNCKPV